MGRSKFPGKPPKTVTRKRIKVLGQPEAVQSDSVTVAENIYYGLSLFNETFGDNEKEHPPFHGFSTKEANLSVSYVKTQRHDAESTAEELANPTPKQTTPQAAEKKDMANVENSSINAKDEEQKSQDKNAEPTENIRKDAAISKSKQSSKIHRPRSRRSCKNIKFSKFMKTPILKSVNNILDQHQRSRQLRNNTAKRLLQRAKSSSGGTRNITLQSGDKSSGVRKFVLPIRSAHSSRVIKPNKRFIEELEEISNTEHYESEINAHVKKAKFASNKFASQQSKVKDENVNNSCTNLKENRNRAKKAVRRVGSKDRSSNQSVKNSGKVSNSTQNAQTSKSLPGDKKSCGTTNKNKTTNSMLANSSQTENSIDTTLDTIRNSKLTVSKGHKQISVPMKVLPESIVPNFESSRIQTRSGGTHPEVPIGSHNSTQSEDNVKLKGDRNGKSPDNRTDTEKNAQQCTENFDAESTVSETGSEHSNRTEDEQSEWTGMKLNGGKVILRKARLKLDNKCIGGTEGPFTTTNSNNKSCGGNLGLTGTIKCGVCGAVRFYRFVKQARKFGIHSCESCRKFISKMIKRQGCAKSTNNTLPILQCHKGDGLCLVPPVVRSQQWNLMRCVYKARCPACWLKMCLKCYNIPAALRTGLNTLLPPIMRDPLSVSLPTVQQGDHDNQSQKLGSCKLSWPAENSTEKNLFKSAMSWRSIDSNQKPNYQGTGGLFYSSIDKFETLNTSPSKKRRKNNRIKVRKKLKNPILSSPPVNQCPQPLRQRLELKGPRVKHVCRSASVALGQPIATFPLTEGRQDNENSKHIPRLFKENEKSDRKEEITKEKEISKDYEDDGTNLNNNTNNNNSSNSSSCNSSSSSGSSSNNNYNNNNNNSNNNSHNNNNLIQQSHTKRGRAQHNTSASNINMMSKSNTETSHTVSIDYWEQYDPAEVSAKGFPLIGSELFHVPAICYLCGSAGKESLVHCQCCCEPYHTFCLEPNEWIACAQPNWCCPRCTICQTCHLRSGPKLSCIRCRQSFHHSCLSKSGVSARLYSPDRPYVCQSCIKCKSCGSEGVNVHVGNLPLCSMCFKLRQQGNYCPLCQRCYNENDFDAKIMECSECSCWVHARCEGLSDERYQILSYLPDSIEYTCRQCSDNSNSAWRSAIEAELKAGFIGVIKSLSKNRKACTTFKSNPRYECSCKMSSNSRKAESFDEKADLLSTSSKDTCNEESEECNSENSIDTEVNLSVKSDPSVNKLELEETDVPNRRGLRRFRQKFHLKECSVRIKNCIPKDSDKQENDRKDANGHESSSLSDCQCSEHRILARPSLTLMSIKRKISSNEYKSLSQFHCDMEHVIGRVGTKELVETYHEILREVFPWFVPKNCKQNNETNGTSALPKDLCKDTDTSMKWNDSISDIWKEEATRASKTIIPRTWNVSNIHVEDSRTCCLCKGLGDGLETKEGRLLYCGQNEWVHANCAFWSNEVFEEIDGSLQNVHSAVSRGRLIRCTECGKKGASVGCCAKNCNNTFHFPCGRNIGLSFNTDKTVYCTSHVSNYTSKTVQNETDFSLKKFIYVELDRKKKKYAEPNKVKVMIGSLTIDCLGTIIPEFSDAVEKITPCDYKCSRLYWSTVNPFKIVRYYVRTYVRVYTPETSNDAENNITIDHSKEEEKEETTSMDKQRLEYLAVKQTLDTLIDSVCNKEVDENLAEQSNADLFPPELKEAIFEDLPHDLFDGISMQDIFPKMTYEDFLGMDLENDGSFATDLFKDDVLTSEVDDIVKPPENKISKVDASLLELGPHNDLWVHLETKTAVQDLMDDLLNSKSQKRAGRELKRSKSEVMSNNSLIIGGQRHHRRSCSLTWSCKLENSYGPSTKRRKLPRNNNASTKSNEASATLADIQNEKASSVYHELRIPESIVVTVGRGSVTAPNVLTDSTGDPNRKVLTSLKDDGKEQKRLFWHTRQQPRILQVDGPADSSSASECGSPQYTFENCSVVSQLDGLEEEEETDEMEKEKQKTGKEDHSRRQKGRNLERLNTREIFDYLGSHVTIIENDNERPVSSPRIPQLDGAGDISSDDESASPLRSTEESERANVIPRYYSSMDPRADRPVTCKKCRCTYRTQDSYDRHLATCDIMITSDSDSETADNNKLASPDSRFSPNVGSVSPRFVALSPSEGHTLSSDYPDVQATSPIEASVPSPRPSIQIEPIAQAIVTPQIHARATVETVHRTVLTSNDVIVQTQYTRTTTTLPNPSVLPQESSVQITEITDSRNVNVTATCPPETDPSPQLSPSFSSTGVQTATNEASRISQLAKTSKAKSPRSSKSRAKAAKPFSSSSPPSSSSPLSSTSSSSSLLSTAPLSSTTSFQTSIKNSNEVHDNHARFQTMQQSSAPVIQLQQAHRPSGPTVILQQVASPGIVSAYVETLQQQAGQNLQYVTAISGQNEAGFKPAQFIATNQLIPGAAYIQTPSDNLLTLQNGGISILPGVQIAQTQPTVLGTIVQQQPSAIQCGVISSEQLLLSSAPTLEMFTDSTGSMFVANHQPMYYGLETIVSNTVMSSSQFMAGTVPQVLASSYQTTTQVFQASKLVEPIVDVQAVPGVPTVAAVQAVPGGVAGVTGVTNVPGIPNLSGIPTAGVTNMAAPPCVPNVASVTSLHSLSGVPTVPSVPAPAIPNSVLGATSSVATVNNVPVPGIPVVVSNVSDATDVSDASDTSDTTCLVASSRSSPITSEFSIQERIRRTVEPIAPVRMTSGTSPLNTQLQPPQHVQQQAQQHQQQMLPAIPRVAVRPSPAATHSLQSPQLNHCSWKITEPLFGTEQPMNNSVRPYFDSKHVAENTSMIKSSISSKINPLPNHCIAQRSTNNTASKSNKDTNNLHIYLNGTITNSNVNTTNISTIGGNSISQSKITMPMNSTVPTSRPMNRVLPMQAVTPKQDTTKIGSKPENPIVEEPTKPAEDEKQMEAVIPVAKSEKSESQNESEFCETSQDKLESDTVEKVKENLKLEIDKDRLQNTSLKIVLQKQFQDGSYKITRNVKTVSQNGKKSPQVTSVEILPSKQVPQIASLQLLPIKTFTLKTNKVEEKIKPIEEKKPNALTKTKSPPIAVKKPRIVSRTTKTLSQSIEGNPVGNIQPQKSTSTKGPSLMYEVKSQDGFTRTASSMAEVWDMVFQAVQSARKAHNLPPLPYNPLSENLGLENNATVYLVEQLPGANRCTKYKPRFHDLTPPKLSENENDLPPGCENGAARAEPFKGRKVHDMFSWLASRHRQQPKMIAISEAESSRRVTSTNLPMAMRFRILKETSKESVGVYHSHIHGRGLFCLRDIEAGEMVIEYAGEVIRASLTDKREKYYDSKNIGCYMFKIDDHLVVDATMKGNAARFINHSCEPNCYSRVVDILGKKHILIFALRRIVQGEELTYDYKFPFEDIKIPCTCGSRRCRKYLN